MSFSKENISRVNDNNRGGLHDKLSEDSTNTNTDIEHGCFNFDIRLLEV